MRLTAAVITVSDKGSRGEREDLSGPNLCRILREHGYSIEYTGMVPDDRELIGAELQKCAAMGVSLLLTTGGTGFSPRDVTPEATLDVIERAVPGIPELMRSESMKLTPRGCLSRGAAGILGRTLIVNLPGSVKASGESLLMAIGPIEHGLEMLLGSGSAECAASPAKKPSPSMDRWLSEAKAHESAPRIGMYLTHNGTVRVTSRACARLGETGAPPVSGMLFSYDESKVDEAVRDTYRLEGIGYVRVWLNEGALEPGDDIMYVLIGGDIRPHVTAALDYLVGRLKGECVSERELYGS